MAAKFLVLLLVVAIVNADKNPWDDPKFAESYLKVINNAARDITDTYVYRTNDVEWGPFNAPQYNFQGLAIQSGGSVSQKEDVNLNAQSSTFRMRLSFVDGSFDEYKINQQYVFDKSPEFEKKYGRRLIKYGKGEDHTLEITVEDRR